MQTGIPLVLGFLPNSQVHLDARYTNDGVPYTNISQVFELLPTYRRALYLPVNVAGIDHWFTPDLDTLVPKTATFTVQEPLGKSGNDIILQYDTNTLALLAGYLKVRDNVFPVLDSGGKIPVSYLPGTTSDIVERANYATMILTIGVANTLYVTTDNNKIYRWSGSQYTELPASLALGTTHDSAGYGDESRAAYDLRHSHFKEGTSESNLADLNKVAGSNKGDETKASIETKLTGVITSHSHPSTTQGGVAPIKIVGSDITLDYDTTQFKLVADKLIPIYQNTNAMPAPVGGLDAGTSFAAPGDTIKSVLDRLLYPYQIPTLSNFAITGYNPLIPFEVGVDLSGSKTFVWARTNGGNIAANTGIIYDGVSTEVQTGISLTQDTLTMNLNIPNIAPINKVYRLQALNSKGGNVISNDFKFSSVFAMYIGNVTSLNPTEATIKLMTKRVLAKGNQVIDYTVDFKRYCFAYPSIYGNLVSITDVSGFENLYGFTKTTATFTTNGITQLYNIYTLISPATTTNFTVTYKF